MYVIIKLLQIKTRLEVIFNQIFKYEKLENRISKFHFFIGVYQRWIKIGQWRFHSCEINCYHYLSKILINFYKKCFWWLNWQRKKEFSVIYKIIDKNSHSTEEKTFFIILFLFQDKLISDVLITCLDVWCWKFSFPLQFQSFLGSIVYYNSYSCCVCPMYTSVHSPHRIL